MNLLKHSLGINGTFRIQRKGWEFRIQEDCVQFLFISILGIICRIHVSSIPDNTDKKMPNLSQCNSFTNTQYVLHYISTLILLLKFHFRSCSRLSKCSVVSSIIRIQCIIQHATFQNLLLFLFAIVRQNTCSKID